jgi:hypothetical protein
VTLAGIDTAWCPREKRLPIWQKLAGEWKPSQLQEICTVVPLREIDEYVRQILAGQIVGRTVVRVSG